MSATSFKVKTESSQLTLLRRPYRNEKYPLLLENGLLLLGNKCGRVTLDVTRGPQIYVSAVSESYSEDRQICILHPPLSPQRETLVGQ